MDFARVGGFHMQGTSGRSYSELCFALNNAAYGSLRLARRVKIDEKKILIYFHAKLTPVKDSALFGQSDKMRHIDFFRANKGTCPGGMSTVNPFITVQYSQPLGFLLFTRVHYAHNACQHRIGS